MSEKPPNPSPGKGAPRPTDPVPRAAQKPELRVAVSSSSSEQPPWGVWLVTLGLILCGGLTLYAARSAVAPTLDRWMPAWQRTPEEAPPAPPEPIVEPAPEIEEPSGPEWTFADIEAAIVPLPERTQTLIAEGRDELSQFKGLDSSDENRALPIRNRWRLWGRIWLNRVEQIRTQIPPLEACELHAGLQPTCQALATSLTLLDRVPATQSLDNARQAFTEAAWVLDAYQGPPQRAPRRR